MYPRVIGVKGAKIPILLLHFVCRCMLFCRHLLIKKHVNNVKPESVFQIICSNETTILLMCFQWIWLYFCSAYNIPWKSKMSQLSQRNTSLKKYPFFNTYLLIFALEDVSFCKYALTPFVLPCLRWLYIINIDTVSIVHLQAQLLTSCKLETYKCIMRCWISFTIIVACVMNKEI
jgi:hypothetical protein